MLDSEQAKNSVIHVGVFSTLKYLVFGSPLRGQAKEGIWNQLKTPLFPLAYIGMSVVVFVGLFLHANRYTDISREQLLAFALRETFFQGGFLVLANLVLLFWTSLMIRFTVADPPGLAAGFIIARRTVYFAAIFQALMVMSFWSGFYGVPDMIFETQGTSFYALVLAPKLLDVAGPLLILLTLLLAGLRLLCVFQGVHLATSGAAGTAFFCSVACMDVWYYLYLNFQWACFYLRGG